MLWPRSGIDNVPFFPRTSAEVPLKDGEAIVEQIISSMVRALQAGDNIEIRGFGSFNT